MKFPRIQFTAIFILIALADLSALQFYNEVRFITKPLIMISLGSYYFRTAIQPEINFLMALVFALLGDIFLMFDNLFLPGVIAFMIMQALYFLVFIRQKGTASGIKYFLGAIVVFIAVLAQWFLWKDTGEMQIPVLIYTFAISVMVISGIWRSTQMSGYITVLLGVFCFLFSDTILAINKFSFDIPHGHFISMTIYILAQYLIVTGYLSGKKKRF